MDWIADVGLYAVPAFALLLGIELFGDYRERRRPANGQRRQRVGFSLPDTLASLSIYGLGRLAALVEVFIELPVIVFAAMLAPLALPASDWRVWVLAIVGADLAYYFDHRMKHRVRLFWAAHSVHHSSRHYNLSTAIRLPWLIPGRFLTSVAYLPLALVGVPVWLIFLGRAIVLLYQHPLHTELIGKLPRPIEFVFNTPSNHRVHHGANNAYLDKNYGGILIVWDRMFGSYAAEDEQVRFGLTEKVDTYNPVTLNFREFVTMLRDVCHAQTWRGRIGYVVAPPGWTERRPEWEVTPPRSAESVA